MSNHLSMARSSQIHELYRLGWSRRRIALELGIHRESVSRHLRLGEAAGPPGPPKPAKVITGSEDGDASKPAKVIAGSEDGNEPKPAKVIAGSEPRDRSKCAPYRALILEKVDAGLSAQRIWQDLVAEQGFTGSYPSVGRMVRRLNRATPLPFRRMECAPGAEAQIDFGPGVPLDYPDGKHRRTHAFRIVLSHSRKAYSEICLRQTTEDLIRCLENAFWAWGGVPETLVVDNLKAAVLQADWYDPELNPKLDSFCKHYGTVLLPTKPYMPRHKGKVESGVKYLCRNALKGRRFTSIQSANEHVTQWEERVADLRIHGTTKRQVKDVFEHSERPALRSLPAERFPFFHEEQRIVHKDGHIEVGKAFYSMPPEYLGRTVWVRWDERLVRIFSTTWKEIALHTRQERGHFSTQRQHLCAKKISSIEYGAEELLRRARRIGPQTGRWAEAMLKDRGIQGVRVLVGLLALVRGHSMEALEQACERAVGCGVFKLRIVRQLLNRLNAPRQTEMAFMEEHPLIRSMTAYGTVVKVSFHEERPWREPLVQPPQENASSSTTVPATEG
jgi:transposase